MSFLNARSSPLWILITLAVVSSDGFAAETPPLEGPLMKVAVKVTNQRQADEFDWFATAHTGIDGSTLPGATTDIVFGLLDSGSATHLLSYPDALALGVQGSYLSGGGTLYGIFGSNLTARRDMVFNGAASQPYLDVTDPIVSPRIRITAIRSTGPNSAEVDWHAEPAPPVLYLQMCTNLPANSSDWKTVATNTLATINGTLSVNGFGPRHFFRLLAP